MRINFFIYLLRTFPPHLGSFFVLFLLSLRFGQIPSGLLQVILPRPRIGMLSLVTVSPEEGQREFGQNVVKEETTQKNYQDEGEKSAINK